MIYYEHSTIYTFYFPKFCAPEIKVEQVNEARAFSQKYFLFLFDLGIMALLYNMKGHLSLWETAFWIFAAE